MDLGIEGRRALITGSTAGIGFAAGRALVREGAKVVLNGRTQARVDAAVKTLRAEFPGAHVGGVAADLGTAAGCEELVDQVPELDILVNSVGIFQPQQFVAELGKARGVDRATIEREFFATARPSSLIQRFASPDEVAAMIAYVCSALASATTGAALRVDGGVVRSII